MCTTARMLTFVAITIAFAASCARPTETVKLYEDSSRIQSSFKRLLVVDVSSDRIMQENLENEIVRRLGREGVDAVPSHTRLDSSNGILQEDLNRLSDEVEADGILVTHTGSVDTTVDFEKGREEIISECRRGGPVDYFLYDHEILIEPDSVKVAHTVVVISNLYDTASRKRVWTIQSTCFQKSSMEEVLLEEAEAIVRQLRIDRLI